MTAVALLKCFVGFRVRLSIIQRAAPGKGLQIGSSGILVRQGMQERWLCMLQGSRQPSTPGRDHPVIFALLRLEQASWVRLEPNRLAAALA